MENDLTIVIPCKNEEKYIPYLLWSLSNQDNIGRTRIIIADAKSTDKTLKVISYFKDLNIEIIEGGLPAVGRNRGLALSQTKWTLFIDSDAEIYDRTLIQDCVNRIESEGGNLLTTKLKSFNYTANILYWLNNKIIYFSKWLDKPFSPGVFMLMRTEVAKNLGGFPEDLAHCEDYFLSKEVTPNKFILMDRYVISDNRRFKKMKYHNMVIYFIKNIFMRNNRDYFKKDINYWK
jgi:glycosyltransferase involved in cell wall biosynthesis